MIRSFANIAGIGLLSLLLCACQSSQPAADPTTRPAMASVVPVNKFCPVNAGNPVDDRCPTVLYDGKVIGFCCPDCIEDFNKDPKKYMANLK
jgi:hypothetical protein